MFKNMKTAIMGECGGPSVETIIGIAVALIMGVALIAFGRMVVGWIGNAQESVNSMEVGDLS
jgi:hypothetical protein